MNRFNWPGGECLPSRNRLYTLNVFPFHSKAQYSLESLEHWIAESGMTMWMLVTKPILRNVQHIAQKFACMLRNDSSSHLSHIRYHIILHDPDNTVCYTCSFWSWRTCTGSLHRHVSHRWVWYTANGCTTCFTYWVEVLQSGDLWHGTQLSGCWSCRLWPRLCNN